MSRPGQAGHRRPPGCYAAGFGFAPSLTRGLRLESDLKLGTYLPLIYHVGDQPFTYSVFLCGGTLVLGRRPNPEHIAEMIAAEQVTALWAGSNYVGVPSPILASTVLDPDGGDLAQHPDVAKAAVVGLPHPRWSEAVTAVVVLRDGAAASGDDLIKHCRASLPGYETPKSVVFAADLPETVGGKVLKYKLRVEHAGHYRDVDP